MKTPDQSFWDRFAEAIARSHIGYLKHRYSSVVLSAVDKGGGFLPGPLFDTDQRYVKSFRVSYAWSTREKIEEGVEILADTIKEFLRHSPGDLGLSGLGNFQSFVGARLQRRWKRINWFSGSFI